MNNKNFSVNIDAEAVKNQYEQEQKTFTPKKTQFNEKNYLQARLSDKETSKTLTIRLLPFSPEGGSPFKKVFMHTVKVNKEVAPNGWKTFVCPTHNKKDGWLDWTSRYNISGDNEVEIDQIQMLFFSIQTFFSILIKNVLKDYNVEENEEDVKKWYDGYTIGDTTGIYNPWSILNYLKNKKLIPYWVNTSSNDLIKLILK